MNSKEASVTRVSDRKRDKIENKKQNIGITKYLSHSKNGNHLKISIITLMLNKLGLPWLSSASSAEDGGSVPGWRTRIPHALWPKT